MPWKKAGMSTLIKPYFETLTMIENWENRRTLINCPTDRTTLVMVRAKPVLGKKVLNIMPSDSPQLTMQKQLRAMMKYIPTVRRRSMAMDPSNENNRAAMIPKGTSKQLYATKKASTEYARSSCSYKGC
jgi:hypothetical protein